MLFQSNTSRLIIFLFFSYSTITIFTTFLPIYFKEIGLTGSQIGWLLSIGPIAAIITQPIWGFLSDKYKSIKLTIILCLIGSIAICLVLFHIRSFLGLMVFLFLFFCFISAVNPLGDSLAKQTSSKENVSFGTIRMFGSLGYGVSALVFGYVLLAIGIEKVFYPLLLFLVITLLFAFFILDVKTSNKPVTIIDAMKMAKEPKLLIFLVIIMFISMTHRTNDNFLGIYIVELGGSESLIGLATFIGITTECLMLITSALWFRRFHETTFIIIAGILYAIRWFLMAAATTPAVILLIQPLHGITFAILFLSAFSYITKILPVNLQATGHVLMGTFMFGISGIIGSLMGGNIIENSGVAELYQVLGILSIIGVFSFFLYRWYILNNNKAAEEQTTAASHSIES